MTPSLFLASLLIAYALASVVYVYRWRGRARYASLGQYLRKSWPLFAPFNCLLYLSTRSSARGPLSDAATVEGVEHIRENWKTIRDEAVALQASGALDHTSTPGAAGYHDLGFRTFYKRGWKKFYLKWYGPAHTSARRLCPRTVAIIDKVPGIRGAMFSFLPAGSELTLHSDPLAVSMRYHLGLVTPNSDDCYIMVDLERLSWRDGEDFVFDETYPHHAMNQTKHGRLILMCDVERPMYLPGRVVNALYVYIAKGLRVRNTSEDQSGPLTRLFSLVAPLQAFGRRVKARHRRSYILAKMVFNMMLASLLLYPFWLLLGAVDQLSLWSQEFR